MSEIDNDLNEMTSKWKREMILSEIRQWSSAEQGVLIADALKMVSINLVKFISIICDDLISKSSNTSEGDPSYINFMEDQANDISYFRVLDEKSTEKKLKHLNMYLPLLRMLSNNRSQNETLKDSYNNLIQNVLEECVFEKKFFTECRDVLLFACMHPIFDNIQKLSFQKWFELIDKSSTDSDQLPTSNLSNHDVNEQHEGKSRKLNVEISSSINAFEKTKTIVTMRKKFISGKSQFIAHRIDRL